MTGENETNDKRRCSYSKQTGKLRSQLGRRIFSNQKEEEEEEEGALSVFTFNT